MESSDLTTSLFDDKSTFSLIKKRVTARYIAPVSKYWYPSLFANSFAVDVLPTPAAPSIVITINATKVSFSLEKYQDV